MYARSGHKRRSVCVPCFGTPRGPPRTRPLGVWASSRVRSERDAWNGHERRNDGLRGLCVPRSNARARRFGTLQSVTVTRPFLSAFRTYRTDTHTECVVCRCFGRSKRCSRAWNGHEGRHDAARRMCVPTSVPAFGTLGTPTTPFGYLARSVGWRLEVDLIRHAEFRVGHSRLVTCTNPAVSGCVPYQIGPTVYVQCWVP